MYGVSRNVPAEIYRKAAQTGTIQTKRRSGRPSLVRNTERQASIVNAVRQQRDASSCSLKDN